MQPTLITTPQITIHQPHYIQLLLKQRIPLPVLIPILTLSSINHGYAQRYLNNQPVSGFLLFPLLILINLM